MTTLLIAINKTGDVNLDDVWSVAWTFCRERLDGTVQYIAVSTDDDKALAGC